MIHRFNDFDIAEDAFQEASISALQSWKNKPIPDDADSWLFITAQRKAIDLMRRHDLSNKKHKHYKNLTLIDTSSLNDNSLLTEDHQLKLIFTCCHPALDRDSQIALTLHTICGFDTKEISKIFFTRSSTMSQRLVRAKKKIKLAAIPFKVPVETDMKNRLDAVLAVLYLIFNESYYSKGNLFILSKELALEAIRMTSLVNKLLPEQPECLGLLALMHFNFARFNARIDKLERSIKLSQQKRYLWNAEYIAMGNHLLKSATDLKAIGSYQIQAAISGVHNEAKNFRDTDWLQIFLLYEKLYQYHNSPIVKLNAAVAAAFLEENEQALTMIEQIEQTGQLHRYHPLHVAKAYILNKVDKTKLAQNALEKAIDLSDNQFQEREFRQELDNLL